MYSLNFSNFEPNKYSVSGGLCGTTIVDSTVPDLWLGDANGYGLVPEKPGCTKCHASDSFANNWK